MTLRKLLGQYEDYLLTLVYDGIPIIRYSGWFLQSVVPAATQDMQATIDGNVVEIKKRSNQK